MQLIYRGTTFNYTPAHINTQRSAQRSGAAYELIYRGNTYQVDPTIATTASKKPMEYKLIYRGSTYQVNRNEQGKVIAVASTNSSNRGTAIAHPATQKNAGEYSL
jgi:hypothetical protein